MGPLGVEEEDAAGTGDWMHAEVEVCKCLTSPGFDFYFRRIDPAGAPLLARRLSAVLHLSSCKNNGPACSQFFYFFVLSTAAAECEVNELKQWRRGELQGLRVLMVVSNVKTVQ